MNSLAEWLTSCGSYVGSNLSYTMGTNMFLGFMPEKPLNCVSLIANGGPRIDGSPVEFSALQIIVRDTDLYNGMTAVSSIHRLFDDRWCVLSPTYTGRFMADHEPGIHILDENGHVNYSLNYTFTRMRR